jgi:hypothetical protein
MSIEERQKESIRIRRWAIKEGLLREGDKCDVLIRFGRGPASVSERLVYNSTNRALTVRSIKSGVGLNDLVGSVWNNEYVLQPEGECTYAVCTIYVLDPTLTVEESETDKRTSKTVILTIKSLPTSPTLSRSSTSSTSSSSTSLVSGVGHVDNKEESITPPVFHEDV